MAVPDERRKLGRNDLCPTCGLKMKRCRGHDQTPRVSWGTVLWCSALALGIILGLCALPRRRQGPQPPAPPKAPTQEVAVLAHLELVSAYVAQKPADEWWLPTAPPVDSPEAAAEVVGLMEAQSERIRVTVKRFTDCTDLTRAIAAQFPHVWSSYDAGGFSHSLRRTDEPLPDGALEVCFIPQDQLDAQGHPAHFYYRPEWQAMMLAGLQMPEAAYAGFLLHELGHALRHRQGKLSRSTALASDEYVDGEVEMHELETSVLDHATSGEFSATLDAILKLTPDVADEQALVLGLTRSDLMRLDRALGALRAGQTISRSLITHAIYALGSRFIADRLPVEQHAARRRAHYRWIRANF